MHFWESGTAKLTDSILGKRSLNQRHCIFHHDLQQLPLILSALFPAVPNTQSWRERQCSSHQGNPLDKIILAWSASSSCNSECESVFSCLYTMGKKWHLCHSTLSVLGATNYFSWWICSVSRSCSSLISSESICHFQCFTSSKSCINT